MVRLIEKLGDLLGDLNPPELGPKPVIVKPPGSGWVKDPPETKGTFDDPFHTISGALDNKPGRSLALMEGTYNRSIVGNGWNGSAAHPIVVQPYQHAAVTIDCFVETLPSAPDGTPGQWLKRTHHHGAEAVSEYVWTETFPDGADEEVSRGAFLDTHQHTRLITYSQLRDLLSSNKRDPHITGFPPPDELPAGTPPPGDNFVWVYDKKLKDFVHSKPPMYRNWVYMGPGIWFDTEARQLHLRLDHTSNAVPHWPDYTGLTDPGLVKLALSKTLTPTLKLTDCSYMVFKDLTLRFGGQETVRLIGCSNLEFDHVNIRAGSRAIRLEPAPNGTGNSSITFHDCEIDGGMPTWLFRSDRKDEYNFAPATLKNAHSSDVDYDELGKHTTNTLISSGKGSSDIQIHHCEIFNGHDLVIFGHSMRFHHNWVNNINDDALYMASGDADIEDAWIYRNVITQVLSALSFAGDNPVKQVSIFRNLFDLRKPTLGIRRRMPGEWDPLRQGQLYKNSGKPEGPFDLWHNTCLTLDAGKSKPSVAEVAYDRAGFTHYRDYEVKGVPAALRRSYNNIFVGAYPSSEVVFPIADLPPAMSASTPTDGNLYQRVGPEEDRPPTQVKKRFEVMPPNATGFEDLEGYQVPDGWEQSGLRVDPGFISFDLAAGWPHPSDDLRPDARHTPEHPMGSPAKGSAVPLPDSGESNMRHIEEEAGGWLAKNFGKDTGCYYSLMFLGLPVDRMFVGVGGRKRFPPGPALPFPHITFPPFPFRMPGR